MTRITSTNRAADWLLFLVCLVGAGLAPAGESRIELTDGSVISGELMGIEGGRYRIRSAAMGEVSLPESGIRSIQPIAGGSASMSPQTPSGTTGYAAEIAAIQQQLATDPGLMKQITDLQNDPLIQSVLSDPALTRSILSGDLDSLRADSRIQRLMELPSVQAIMGQTGGR